MSFNDEQMASFKEFVQTLTPEQKRELGLNEGNLNLSNQAVSRIYQQQQLAETELTTRTTKAVMRLVAPILLVGIPLALTGYFGAENAQTIETGEKFALLFFGSIIGTILSLITAINYVGYQMGKPNPPAWIARIRDDLYPDAKPNR